MHQKKYEDLHNKQIPSVHAQTHLGQLLDECEPLREVHPDVGLGQPAPEDGRVRGGQDPTVDDAGLAQDNVTISALCFLSLS